MYLQYLCSTVLYNVSSNFKRIIYDFFCMQINKADEKK